MRPGYGHEDHVCSECGSSLVDTESGCLKCGAPPFGADRNTGAAHMSAPRSSSPTRTTAPANHRPHREAWREVRRLALRALGAAKGDDVVPAVIVDLEKIVAIARRLEETVRPNIDHREAMSNSRPTVSHGPREPGIATGPLQEWTTCPRCRVRIRTRNLDKHLRKQH